MTSLVMKAMYDDLNQAKATREAMMGASRVSKGTSSGCDVHWRSQARRLEQLLREDAERRRRKERLETRRKESAERMRRESVDCASRLLTCREEDFTKTYGSDGSGKTYGSDGSEKTYAQKQDVARRRVVEEARSVERSRRKRRDFQGGEREKKDVKRKNLHPVLWSDIT